MPYEKAAENGEEIPMKGDVEYGRGKRKAEKKSLTSDEEDDNEFDAPSLPKVSKQVLYILFIGPKIAVLSVNCVAALARLRRNLQNASASTWKALYTSL